MAIESRIPNKVNTKTVTAENTYTPHDIVDATTSFGDWIKEGTWIYSVPENTFYKLTPKTEGYTFELKNAKQIVPNKSHHQSETNIDTKDDIKSVCELEGEITAGRWIGIPAGETISRSDILITNTGEYLLVDQKSNKLSNIASSNFDQNSPPLRYTDGSPKSISNTISQADQLSANTLIFSINGSFNQIKNILPTCILDSAEESNQITDEDTLSFDKEDTNITTRFIPTGPHPADTFTEPNLRKYVLHHMEGDVLNACAGPTRLSEWYSDGKITTNDINPEIDTDLTVDITELAAHLPKQSYDCIIFDPPWSAYQSRLRYNGYRVEKSTQEDIPAAQISTDIRQLPFKIPGEDQINGDTNKQTTLKDMTTTPSKGEEEPQNKNRDYPDYITEKEKNTPKTQIGHAKIAKMGFDYLLKPGGKVIQLAYTGSIMPAVMEYKRIDRTAFDPHGIKKTLIAGVDKKSV